MRGNSVKCWQRAVHIAVVLCSLVGLSSYGYCGAWPMPKGKGQVITTTVTDNASRGFDNRWQLTQDVTFSKFETQFFWEHGLSEKITLIGTTAYQDVDFRSREGQEDVQGFGNSSVGLRYQVFAKDRFVGALQLSYIVAGEGENIADADLGRGGNGLEIRGLIGQGFKVFKREAFIDLQSAWIYRARGSPDTFKDDLTVGIIIDKKRQILTQAFYSRTNSQTLGFDRVLANENLKLQASIVFKRSETTSTQLGVFQTVAGRNIVQEKGVFAAVWRRY